MAYLRRKIDSFLSNWKKDPLHKPLIVRGSRQIGKTESIRRFAASNYGNVIEINFVEEKKYRTITDDGYKAEDIIKNISRIDPDKHFLPGETLIFFDEIQSFPDIATSLKFFAQQGNYDVICSGSMLGINYREIESCSVGYKQDYQMYSMDFEEFLWASRQDSLTDELLDCMLKIKPLSSTTWAVLERLFLDYNILGGMPAVVSQYIEKGTFEGTLAMQRQLLLDYKEDIRKYAVGVDQSRIINVYESIPYQLAKANKKFQLSKISHGARFKDYRGCIEWLIDAGVVNACYCLNFPELPLRGNCDRDKFKLYMADTGLLVSLLDDESQDDLRSNKNLGVYKGALYENMVAEAFVKSGLPLYYYRREDSTLEEDFFIRTADALVPVEVKAENAHSKALSTLIYDARYTDISWGIKLYSGNIEKSGPVLAMPHCCAYLLKKWINIL